MPLPIIAPNWPTTPTEAVAVQRDLAAQVRVAPLAMPVRTVAGLDVGIRGEVAHAAVVVVDVASGETVETTQWRAPVTFPYVPGLLSFREIPALLPALALLATSPDVLLLDGQGLAHPRRAGLACHLGVLLDRPAFGAAKSLLVGRHAPLPPERGAHAPLIHRGEVVGAALRTRTGVSPVYVSVGHRITLAEALDLTLALSRTRLPEPAKRAHRLTQRP